MFFLYMLQGVAVKLWNGYLQSQVFMNTYAYIYTHVDHHCFAIGIYIQIYVYIYIDT
jgi:hypothetical protein